MCVEGEREIPYVREKKRRGVCEVRTDCGEKERERPLKTKGGGGGGGAALWSWNFVSTGK